MNDPLTRQRLDKLRSSVGSALLGKPESIDLALIALLAEGHLLIEDVPGVGKTLLAKALAKSLRCTFHRIQFTPDLLPSDLIGTSVYKQAESRFEFQPGPVFAQIVLADEINRASPRTQSALLEAMGDRQVSLDGLTHPLGAPFLVLATQNPWEFEGTYPLPESQLDRFLMRLSLGYPSRDAERAIFAQHRVGEPEDGVVPVLDATEVVGLQERAKAVTVDDRIAEYLLDLIHATRAHADVSLGASTRAALSLYRAAQARALLEGREYCVPDDVKRLAGPVLGHRLILRGRRGGDAGAAEAVVADIVGTVVGPG